MQVWFIILDHTLDIHFQYNGFLFGLFIYSIAYLLQVSI